MIGKKLTFGELSFLLLEDNLIYVLVGSACVWKYDMIFNKGLSYSEKELKKQY